MLKPQDVLVALKLLAIGEERRNLTFSSLATSLGLSVSETHAAVSRAARCRLVSSLASTGRRRDILPAASVGNLLRFVENGLPYVLPAEKGTVVWGMPTGVGASPLREQFIVGTDELLPVWPWSSGACSGIALTPLYRSCPIAAANDPQLYRLLTLVDAIRDEGVRQRQVALRLLVAEVQSLAPDPRLLVSHA